MTPKRFMRPRKPRLPSEGLSDGPGPVVIAGGTGFLDGVLDQGLVDDREHLLGHGLGGRQEAGAESCDGKYGLADFFTHGVVIGEPVRNGCGK